MRTSHRAYSEEAGDFRRLGRFLIAHEPAVRAYSTWSLGRLVDWKYGLYDDKRTMPGFCERNAQLWFDAFDEPVGFAVSESGDAGFAVITLPGYRFLFPQILAWVLDRWGARGPRMTCEITEQQGLEAAALDRAGFRRATTFATREFDLTAEAPLRAPLEPGFTIVDMATHPDYRAQRILRDDAFSNRPEPAGEVLQQELRFYNYTHEGPIYHPECDLCVMAPDGRLVAGCEALIDAHNAAADVERVCTHSAFRRRGFARAVILACLARLRDMGLRRVYITGYSLEALALYGSLCAAAESRAWVYVRQTNAGAETPGAATLRAPLK